jgi:hypothetical protein
LADFLTARFFAGAFFTLFLTALLAEVFFADFLAAFLTATVVLLGLRLKYRFKTQ